MSWGWKGAAIATVILSTCIIVLFTFLTHFYFLAFLSLAYLSANSLRYYLVLLSLHSAITVSSFINPINGGWKKGHWGFFWKVLQKLGSVFTARERAGLRDVEPAVFYNVVLSVTWQLTAVQLPSPPPHTHHPHPTQPTRALQTDPVIFSIRKMLGVTSMSDCGWSQMGVFL